MIASILNLNFKYKLPEHGREMNIIESNTILNSILSYNKAWVHLYRLSNIILLCNINKDIEKSLLLDIPITRYTVLM